MSWLGLIQIAIIAALLWLFYRSFIRNTSSEKMVHGLFSLGLLWLASFVMTWADLPLLGGFLHWTAMILSVGLVVIFQPELRKFFTLMGNVRRLRDVFFRSSEPASVYEKSASAIVTAVEHMASRHIGALMVFRSPMDFEAVTSKGVKIDAEISTELLITIFHNKTPLHDGAVIIEDNRILYAGAILPLSTADANWKYGTRHRAAVGQSEINKSVVLVISEERGEVSIAENGKLTRFDDMKKLRTKIEKVMGK